MCVVCHQGTVQSLERYGMHVKISEHIKGLVPRIHLADILLTNPEKKYKEDMKVKCKVSDSRALVLIRWFTFPLLIC